MGRVLRDCKEVAIPFRAGAKRYAALRPRGLQRQRRCTNQGGIFSFRGKRISPLHPPRERVSIGSLELEHPLCLRSATACVAVLLTLTAIGSAIRLASASIIRCCAAVGGSAALRMRHTPCGCRSAHLVEVQPNFRLPPVPTMRRAQQCRYFARSLPPSYRHSRLTIVRRGCNT